MSCNNILLRTRYFCSMRKRLFPLFCWIFITGSLLWTSCKPIDLYEYNVPIPGYRWKKEFSANGSFEVKDTSSAYQISIVLRHTDAYAYNNIWLDMALQLPGDSMYHQKINLSLANDAQGWEGSGMNDIWEVRKQLNAEPRRFRKAGKYYFSIRQIMRDDPLPQVMSVGLRVEKAQP